MKPIIAIIGEGRLAECTFRLLTDRHPSPSYEVVKQNEGDGFMFPDETRIILLLQDEEDTAFFLEAETALWKQQIPWLCGSAASDGGIAGPWVRPSTSGCFQCASARRLVARPTSTETLDLEALLLFPGSSGSTDAVTPPSQAAVTQVALLLAAEARRAVDGKSMNTLERIYYVDMETLQTSLHYFLPDPLCPVCGVLPEDSPESARIHLLPRIKKHPESYRTLTLDKLGNALAEDYLDERTGLFNGIRNELASLFASVTVRLPQLTTNDEYTAGRSHNYKESEWTAVLEGLERYCGLAPRGKRPILQDSYCNIADQAIQPTQVGLYTEAQYAQPEFPFEPFDPLQPISWVWGYSFMQQRPVLVPEKFAYYSSGYGDSFVEETSNGCALGGSLEEAVFHGIMEVVERDAFLITWYSQLVLPRLDPYSAGDPELRLMIERLDTIAGYEVRLFNMTMDSGIPCIWALLRNRSSTGVRLINAAGAHADPVIAAKSAIHEAAGMLPVLQQMLGDRQEEAERMLLDSSLVKQMSDHILLYSLPEAEDRLSFLLEGERPLRAFKQQFPHIIRHSDLTDDLIEVLSRFRQLGLDVVVVDQSCLETEKNGLYCVKVIIPGMIPMTFGQHLTRLSGLERLFSVPEKLGYVSKALTMEQLNPHPHPFP